jgi:hypothetical protein
MHKALRAAIEAYEQAAFDEVSAKWDAKPVQLSRTGSAKEGS